ncbi:MAG TPA: GNAT family N-acetyltransferase [Pseudonocardiaceae bacterium]|nr:GNAT family N-acetyltransferase [Pseudonocardiaceae bacterium]
MTQMPAGGLVIRPLVESDASLLVEATRGETDHTMWRPWPIGPFDVAGAREALRDWQGDKVSYGILSGADLLGAVGVMRDGPDSAEMAYWVRPESRRQGIGAYGLAEVTRLAHGTIGHLWLEIEPANTASQRLAAKAGYRYGTTLPRHCRLWLTDDPATDEWHDCLIWTYEESIH